MLPGAGCDTAQETALRLAIYAAAPYEIDKKNPNRAEKGAANTIVEQEGQKRESATALKMHQAKCV